MVAVTVLKPWKKCMMVNSTSFVPTELPCEVGQLPAKLDVVRTNISIKYENKI